MRVYVVPNDVPRTISEPIFSPEFKIRFHAWLNFFFWACPKMAKTSYPATHPIHSLRVVLFIPRYPKLYNGMNVLLCAEKLHIYAVPGLYPDAFLTQKVGEIALWMEWLVLQMTKSLNVPG
jgi:hypothetical protein